jgi:hypothetical protein
MGLLDLFSTFFRSSTPGNVLAPGRGWTVPVVGEASYQDDIQSLYRKHGGSGHDLKVGATVARARAWQRIRQRGSGRD